MFNNGKATDDRGVTLIEMLVVISILGTVLAIVTEGLIVSQRTLGDNASRLNGLSQTNVAVEAMTRVLRTAILPSQVQATCSGCDVAAFIKGDTRYVEFYANVDNDGILPTSGTTDYGPRRVTYSVDAQGVLTETVQKPNVHAYNDFDYQYCTPGPSCPVRKRVLARDVEDGTLFTYYDRTGATIATPLQSAVSRLKAVDSIDLVIRVRPSDRTDSATVTARVTLPNADSLIQPTPTP
jgi:prepilin-type N-terminal cleavage/methylation domain-containing protein